MAELQEVDVTISGLETLLSTRNAQGTVMNFIFEPLELSTGMDSLALASVSILVEDGNHRTALGLNNTTSSDQRKVGDLMTINSTHINSARRG